MRTVFALSAVVASFALVSAADEKDPTKGKWVIESVTRDGKAVDALKGAVRVHTDGSYTLTPAAGSKAEPSSGTSAKGGTFDGKTLQGIVKVDGDTLTIAYAAPGKDRPTTFESKEGNGVTVAVHKKAK